MRSPEGSSVTFRRVPAGLRRAPIERFARTLQEEIAKGRPFDILIAGDTELRRLNRDFRGRDYATDVLSFQSVAAEDGESRPPLPGPANPELNGKMDSPQRRRERRDKRRENQEQAQRKGQASYLPWRRAEEAESAERESRQPVRGTGSGGGRLGDIAISLGRARAQAREFGHAIEQEIQILMLHGVLHLTGHDHETDSGAMARAEKRWRAKLGLPNGLIERVRS